MHVTSFLLAHRVSCLCSVGMLFLPDDDKLEAEARRIIEDVVAAEGRCRIVGWREVPVVKDIVGPLARENEPRIVQVRVHIWKLHQTVVRCGTITSQSNLWGFKAKNANIHGILPREAKDVLPALQLAHGISKGASMDAAGIVAHLGVCMA